MFEWSVGVMLRALVSFRLHPSITHASTTLMRLELQTPRHTPPRAKSHVETQTRELASHRTVSQRPV